MFMRNKRTDHGSLYEFSSFFITSEMILYFRLLVHIFKINFVDKSNIRSEFVAFFEKNRL
jgi:hypothetical protein